MLNGDNPPGPNNRCLNELYDQEKKQKEKNEIQIIPHWEFPSSGWETEECSSMIEYHILDGS